MMRVNINALRRRKLLHSALLHTIALCMMSCLPRYKSLDQPILINLPVNFDTTDTEYQLSFAFDAEPRYQEARQMIHELRRLKESVFGAYGVALDMIKSVELSSSHGARNYEVEDFYKAVARHWSATRPMASIGARITIKVVFYKDKIIVNPEGALPDNSQVFVQRAIAAVYGAYQDRRYHIPADTTLQFSFQI
jgi:hypothetical protein